MGVTIGGYDSSIGDKECANLQLANTPTTQNPQAKVGMGYSAEEDSRSQLLSLWEFEATSFQNYIHVLENADTWGNEGFVSAAS